MEAYCKLDPNIITNAENRGQTTLKITRKPLGKASKQILVKLLEFCEHQNKRPSWGFQREDCDDMVVGGAPGADTTSDLLFILVSPWEYLQRKMQFILMDKTLGL